MRLKSSGRNAVAGDARSSIVGFLSSMRRRGEKRGNWDGVQVQGVRRGVSETVIPALEAEEVIGSSLISSRMVCLWSDSGISREVF